jgi:hypothetical protein
MTRQERPFHAAYDFFLTLQKDKKKEKRRRKEEKKKICT